MSFGGGGEKCAACSKTAYAAEQMPAQGRVFHRECFRCNECNTRLGANNWCIDSGGQLFCKPHFLQLLNAGGQAPHAAAPLLAQRSARAALTASHCLCLSFTSRGRVHHSLVTPHHYIARW